VAFHAGSIGNAIALELAATIAASASGFFRRFVPAGVLFRRVILALWGTGFPTTVST
jgi:hypothetical protein